MNTLLKILLRIIIITIVIVIAIYAIRWINHYRYQDYMISDDNEMYMNPSDFSLYDRDVDGVDVDIVEEGLVNGFHLKPDELTSEGVIVTFGGSEGSSNYEVAQDIAKAGYEVYSLFYFGPNELPDELKEVPLDLFDAFLDYHEENSQSHGPITVLGASKGAELTLNLASRYEDIDHIVLFAPTAFSFFSLDQKNQDKSSWTYKDQAVPYLSSRDGSFLKTLKMIGGFIFYYPVNYAPIYQSVIEGSSEDDLEAARIKVEDYKGDGLVFAGGDDAMWPSTTMAKTIESNHSQLSFEIYPEAGHLFSADRYMGEDAALIALGGNKEMNQAANTESFEILMDHLSEWHQKTK